MFVYLVGQIFPRKTWQVGLAKYFVGEFIFGQNMKRKEYLFE